MFLSNRSLNIIIFLDTKFKLTFQHELDNSVRNVIIEIWQETKEYSVSSYSDKKKNVLEEFMLKVPF